MQNEFLSHADAALRNRNTVLHYVRRHAPISRTEIWEKLNISRASVTQVIRQLQESNLLLETGQGESTGGRKPRYLTFHFGARKLYAFDWTSHTLCLMDLGGTILYETTIQFDRGVRPVAFASVIRQEIERIDGMALCPKEEILGFGVSLPGLIDSRNGRVIYSVELDWQNVCLKELFSDRFGENIFLERTGNVMALGEYTNRKNPGSSHFQLFLLGSDGIGVSTVIHGNCQHGASFMHGELGHIKLLDPTPCSCGQQGCLEAVIRAQMKKNNGCITEQVLEYLAIGISSAINISDPGAAILVGSYVDQMTPAQKTWLTCAIRDKVTGQHLRHLEVRFSHDIKQLALQGISAYVFDRYFAVD